jgi:hypothetical protein
MAIAAAVAALALIVFLLWCTFGTRRNTSRGDEMLRWLQEGLPRLGPESRMRWLGSSAVQLDIDEADDPFTSAQVNVVLERRDIGGRSGRRGRRDFLILRGTLPGPPKFEIEAGNSTGGTSTDRLDRLEPGAWVRVRWTSSGTTEAVDQARPARPGAKTGKPRGAKGTAAEPPCVEVAHAHRAGADDIEAMRRAWDQLAAASGCVYRLSVRNLAPHIEVHLEPPATGPGGRATGSGSAGGACSASAADLLGAFGSLGRLARRDS